MCRSHGVYTRQELRELADAYIRGTGVSSSALSVAATAELQAARGRRNARLFRWIDAGRDILLSSAESASKWFDENWPEDVPWPAKVRRQERGACR